MADSRTSIGYGSRVARAVIFGFDPLVTASVILVVTYLLVITDRFDRSLLALLAPAR